jgi:hypothetical protein
MNKIQYSISLLFIALLSFQPLLGQDLPSEEVEVIKSFDARLANAERLELNPQLPSFDTTELDYQFTIQQRTIEHSYSPPALRSLGVPRPPDENIYNAYLRGGYGLPSSPLIDAHYAYDDEEQFAIRFDGQHYSVNNSSNLEHQFIMDNDIHLSSKITASDAFAINAYADYSLDRYDLYGYDHELDSFTDFAAKRQYNTLEVGVGIENPAPNDANFNYNAGIFYRNHKDNRATKENTLGFSGELSKWFKNKNPLRLEFGGDLTTFTDTSEQKINNVFLIPSFSFYKKNWSAKIGLQWASGAGENYFYPDLNLQVRLAGSKLVAFAGSNGQLQAQNFFNLSSFNPFINSKLDSLRNTSQLNIYGGVKGKLKQFHYKVKASYSLVENIPLFLADENDKRFFNPVYDNGNILGLDVSASYNPSDRLELSATASYKMYALDSFDYAWHLPNLTIDTRLSYALLNNDLNVWGGLRFQNGVPVPDENNGSERLEALLDVSLGADYYFSEYFGLFVHAYNLTNNNRQRWQQYPIIGTNVLGGILVRF